MIMSGPSSICRAMTHLALRSAWQSHTYCPI